jgi:hypothetical protein
MPGNSIAGKVFKIDVHTSLTDGKSTPAGPAEWSNLMATVAGPVSCAAAFQPHVFRFINHVAHGNLVGAKNFSPLREKIPPSGDR